MSRNTVVVRAVAEAAGVVVAAEDVGVEQVQTLMAHKLENELLIRAALSCECFLYTKTISFHYTPLVNLPSYADLQLDSRFLGLRVLTLNTLCRMEYDIEIRVVSVSGLLRVLSLHHTCLPSIIEQVYAQRVGGVLAQSLIPSYQG